MTTNNDAWRKQLQESLSQRKHESMLRQLTPLKASGPWVTMPDGSVKLNLASNDYLGLADHPHLKSQTITAIEQHGTGSGASRLVSGHRLSHASCEKRFAAFKHAQAALLCPTGFMANMAVLTTLCTKHDLILADKLCHASLLDAARASEATLRTFAHLDLGRLQQFLQRHFAASGGGRVFIVTDSVFSMDGDTADLPALVALARQYDAILVVDEAHGTGVLGTQGSGLSEAQGVAGDIDITISTASKALGSFGGIITADDVIIQTLVNNARSFIYTTATPASHAAGIEAALDAIRDEPQRRQRVTAMARQLREAIKLPEQAIATPIIPIVTGDAASAVALASKLAQAGFHAPAIRPPTVAPGTARVRITLRADMEEAHITKLIDTLHSSQ